MVLCKVPCKVMSNLHSPWALRLDEPCCSGEVNLSLWPAKLGAGASAQHSKLAATSNPEAVRGRSCQLPEAWWLTGKDDSSPPQQKIRLCLQSCLPELSRASISLFCQFCHVLFLPLLSHFLSCLISSSCPDSNSVHHTGVAASPGGRSPGLTLLSCTWYKSLGRHRESTGDLLC